MYFILRISLQHSVFFLDLHAKDSIKTIFFLAPELTTLFNLTKCIVHLFSDLRGLIVISLLYRLKPARVFTLHLRSHLHPNISRCQGKCGEAITKNTDLLVKSHGETKWMKGGKQEKRVGTQYIHNKEVCLRAYDKDQDKDVHYGEGEEFDFGRLVVAERTKAELTELQKMQLREFGVKLD